MNEPAKMIQHDFTQHSTKQLIERYATMKLTLNNPACEPCYEPIKNTMQQIKDELNRRAYA